MSLKLFKSKSKIGIDIGTAAIKIVELGRTSGRFSLINYGIFELSGGDPATGREGILRLPDEEIVAGIKDIISRAKILSRRAVASIPSFSTFATTIEMPYLSQEDLARAVPFEARKYIPLPINDVILDWSIINVIDPGKLIEGGGPTTGRGLQSKSTTVEVFIAAVPKEDTSRYQSIMKAAGMNLVALEPENSAMIRALLGNDLTPASIINIGGRSTSIIVVDRGYERVSHNYEVGGFEVTKAIARSLGVDLKKAEDLKRKLGFREADENVISDAMAPLIDMIVFEAQKVITGFEDSSNKRVAKVLLVGGMANTPKLIDYIGRKMGRDVYIGNPFARIVYPKDLQPSIADLSNTFSIALGLAMRED